MSLPLRFTITFLALVLSYYFILWIPFAFMPLFDYSTREWISGICAALVGMMVWQASPDAAKPLRHAILLGCLWGGSVGFVLGFIGPMLVFPGANQGPMLAFFSGPLGALLGTLFGFVYYWVKSQSAEA